MVFTLWAVVVPFLVALVCHMLLARGVNTLPVALAFYVCGYWFIVGLWLTPVYWVARVVRRAWRDGGRPDRDPGL